MLAKLFSRFNRIPIHVQVFTDRMVVMRLDTGA
jgi:hypothetical protein